jgi:hypothetical protein
MPSHNLVKLDLYLLTTGYIGLINHLIKLSPYYFIYHSVFLKDKITKLVFMFFL